LEDGKIRRSEGKKVGSREAGRPVGYKAGGVEDRKVRRLVGRNRGASRL